MKQKLLIADDERGIVDMMKAYFSPRYGVFTAYSGEETLEREQKRPYLRNPITVLRGSIKLLRQDAPDEEAVWMDRGIFLMAAENLIGNGERFGMGLYSSSLLCLKHGGRLYLEKIAQGALRSRQRFR